MRSRHLLRAAHREMLASDVDSMISPEALAIAIVVLVIGVAIGLRPFLRWRRSREAQRAMREFRLRREMLEAKFFDIASSQGKPRGLRWKHCDWQPAVTFARDIRSGLLTAFVSVEIHFEAIEGGDMEDVAAVGTIRDATAVFHYQSRRWGTGGKALFNMNPHDALTRLEGQYQPLEKGAGLFSGCKLCGFLERGPRKET